ncbi:MAG: hypothetical protein GF308_14110 [Candidatus Heimdallarchaeota archaeon]|nr:hypothetical protein [Candidatus Heimdallarchaeota archaeon]
MVNKLRISRIILFVFLILGTLPWMIVRAQDIDYADGPEPIGLWDSSDSLDSVVGVAVNDDSAFLAISGFGVRILDVSDPTNPMSVSSFELESEVKAITYSADKIYVGVGSELKIFDVSDPMNPSSITNISQHSTVQEIAVDGSYIYIADHSGSLMIATEAGGNLYSTLPNANDYWCYDVVVSEYYAYTATSSQGLIIWDISDKYNPTIVGGSSTDETAYSITFYGEDKVIVGGLKGYLGIFDVSSVTDPTLLDSITVTSDIMAIQTHENTAIAADYTDGIVTFGLTLDTLTPGNCLLPDGERAHDVEINDQYVFGAMGFSGFMIWDLDEAIKSFGVGFPFYDWILLGTSGIIFLTLVRYKLKKRK